MAIRNIPKLLVPSEHVNKQTYNERMTLCHTCPNRIKKEGLKFNKKSRCPFCKCFIHLKCKIRQEECPVGDWNKD